MSSRPALLGLFLFALLPATASPAVPLSPFPPELILGSPQVVGDKVIATWLPREGAASYRVYLDGELVGEVTFHQWVGDAPPRPGVYRLQLSARDAEGREGPRSAPRTFSTLPPRPPPLKEQLDPLNGRVTLWWEVTDGMVTALLWVAPAAEGPWELVAEQRSNAVENLRIEFDRDYFFALSVKDVQNRESGKGPPLLVRIPRPQPLPPLSWFEGRPYLASGAAVLTWNRELAAVRYLVFRDDRLLGETTEPIFVWPLPPGPGIHAFQVAGVDREGVTGERSPVAALEIPALPAPSGVKASPAKGGGVALAWKEVAGAREYAVFRRDPGGGGFREAGRSRGPRFASGPLPPGRVTSFAVAAIDGEGRTGERSFPLKLEGGAGGRPFLEAGIAAPAWREGGRGGAEALGKRVRLAFLPVEGAVSYRVRLNGRPHAEVGKPTFHGFGGARPQGLVTWTSTLDLPGRFTFQVAGVDEEGEEGPLSEPREVAIGGGFP